MKCEYCDEHVQEGDQKYIPDDLPGDIPDAPSPPTSITAGVF